MKKIIASALVLVFCLVSFCSCGDYTDEYKYVDEVYSTSKSFFVLGNSDLYIENKSGVLTLNTKRQAGSGYDYIGYEVNCVGILTRFWLTTSNFDDMIVDGMWQDGFSAEQIRIDTKTAFKVKNKELKLEAYFLIQTDGTALYVIIEDDICKRIKKFEKI